MNLEELASLRVDKGSTAFLRLNNYTGLAVKTSQKLILVDPDISAPRSSLNPDLILVSHSHPKHFTPAYVATLASENTKIVGTSKVLYSLKKMHFKFPHNLHALRPGEVAKVGDTIIEAHKALHPYKALVPSMGERFASLDEGGWGGEQHLSFALTPQGSAKIYHMSDSMTSSDLRKISEVEIAILPVNLDSWNSPGDAILAVEALEPEVVLAMRNVKKGGFLERWSARRECRKFTDEMNKRGIKTSFLERNNVHALEFSKVMRQ
jgi:L-ascorbate metabolism protein UlaG (beta-lactamase superfamily)